MKRKRLLYFFLAVILVLGAFALYVGINVRRELTAARRILGTASEDLSSSDVIEFRRHLEAAKRILNGPPAAVVRLIPLARQNIQAVDAVVDSGLPVMDDAMALIKSREVISEQELVRGGRVRLELLEELQEPFQNQLESLRVLESELFAHRSGWLVPPLWDAVDDLATRATELRSSAEKATQAIEIAPSLLGVDGPRTYLVLLLNNAELRGAGGILSGVGTFTADNGRLALQRFSYYADIAIKPAEPVQAPEDFERRFGRYRANTTTVVNATASPDVPEVAAVAARLFERIRGQSVDGVMLIDPRGISSLMPDNARASVAGSDVGITNENLADFIYSDSYDILGGADPGRRSAILTAGRSAFRAILDGGAGAADVLDSAGAALAGGHIRFVSLQESEQEVLSRLGVAGSLSTDSVDSLLVTVQNLGADKLDYWMRRRIEHGCAVREDAAARCETVVTLSNETPRGLNDYVTQIDNMIKRSFRYGVYLGYLEVYVPDTAQLTEVTLNGRTETFFPESENGRKSLGMYFSTPRGEKTTVRVSYELPVPDSGYSLQVSPQPLAFDAEVKVDIHGPADWDLSGPGSLQEDSISFEGKLAHPIRFESRPAGRGGIAAAWQTFVEFWTEPLRL